MSKDVDKGVTGGANTANTTSTPTGTSDSTPASTTGNPASATPSPIASREGEGAPLQPGFGLRNAGAVVGGPSAPAPKPVGSRDPYGDGNRVILADPDKVSDEIDTAKDFNENVIEESYLSNEELTEKETETKGEYAKKLENIVLADGLKAEYNTVRPNADGNLSKYSPNMILEDDLKDREASTGEVDSAHVIIDGTRSSKHLTLVRSLGRRGNIVLPKDILLQLIVDGVNVYDVKSGEKLAYYVEEGKSHIDVASEVIKKAQVKTEAEELKEAKEYIESTITSLDDSTAVIAKLVTRDEKLKHLHHRKDQLVTVGSYIIDFADKFGSKEADKLTEKLNAALKKVYDEITKL